MTTERIEAAKLTDEEMNAVWNATPDEPRPFKQRRAIRAIANAATAKPLRIQDARHQALVKAARATVAWHNHAAHGWYLDDLTSPEKQDFRKMISTLVAAIALAEKDSP